MTEEKKLGYYEEKYIAHFAETGDELCQSCRMKKADRKDGFCFQCRESL